MITVNSILRLIPKSKRGKQLVKGEFGDIVRVVKAPQPVACFNGELGIFVCPVEKGNEGQMINAVFKAPRDWNSRWIRAVGDENFDYVEIPGVALVDLVLEEQP
jgi:hypothetical protein